jgi:hypothetical protein
MLYEQTAPKENPYAHIAPEKYRTTNIFVMLLYVLVAPVLTCALSVFSLMFSTKDPSPLAQFYVFGFLILLPGVVPQWIGGLYLAHTVTNHRTLSRRIYYFWSVIPASLLFVCFFIAPAHSGVQFALYAFVFVMSLAATAEIMLLLVDPWLKNTPFALQFAKKSPPVSATEN